MDMTRWKELMRTNAKQCRIVIIVLLAGILLMTIPENTTPPEAAEELLPSAPEDLQDTLAHILSSVQGVGNVEVLLTQSRGAETIYQTNSSITKDSDRQDTVLVTTAEREEVGLVRQSNPPVFLGAIVVCQGAENAQVRLSVVEAVKSATGLTADRITVLKMK